MKKFRVAVLIMIIVVVSFCGLYIYDRQGRFDAKIWAESRTFTEEDYYVLNATNDSYRVVQITDLHLALIFSAGNSKTYDWLQQVIDVDKPDLIVVTGDLTLGLFNRQMLRTFANFMEERRQLWAYVLGNHDFQWGSGAYRYLSVLEDYQYCLFDVGYTNLGYGNKFAVIYDKAHNPIHTLTFLDTSGYRTNEAQAKWYRWGINALNSSVGTLDNILFMHIPLQIVRDHKSGTPETISPLKQEPHLLESITAVGQTKIVANGHDHLNDYTIDIDGIKYISCPSFGFSGYFRKDCARALYIYDIYADRVDILHKTQYDYSVE